MQQKNLLCWLLVAILVHKGLCVPTVASPPAGNKSAAADDDDDDWDDDDSSEADDDGRVYKNPRNSPSTECPRDEEQATLLGQKCLRKCSSDEDCKSKKKKCLCDGACGMSCIKPDRECPELSQPQLGTVTFSSNHFGARATYTCPHGYHVVGLQSRLCQADGHWAGTEPACKQNIYCLAPPTIEHARHSALPEQATFDLDSTVQYHCHTGYATAGFPRAKCLAIDGQASWYGPDISCEPRSCGQPPDPAHGWHAGECYSFGCRVTYHCGDGYELVGKQERFCQADGSWIPKELPTCVLVTAVQCPPPENPRSGKAIYTSVSYNSVVSYECKYGFTLIGESSRRCGADKRWSGTLPSCKEINCGHPGTLYNGWLENIESGTGLGASIIFRCHPGMLLEGHTSTVCQIDGRWRYALPQCLAPCVIPTILQGTVIPIETEIDINGTTTAVAPGLGASTKARHGAILEVLCDEHYEFPVSSLSPPTCNNGTWTVMPRCSPARCKSMPKPPRNGMVIAPKTEHGMRARFKCKDGFKLTGPGFREVPDASEYVLTCSFGNWTGETPACQEVYCAFPGYIPNGKVLLVGNMGLYDYRPYVKKVVNNKQIMYECDKGYVLQDGPVGATCIGGHWSPIELPQCLLLQHPRLRWNRRRRSIFSQRRHKRSEYLLRFYRSLQRLHAAQQPDLHDTELQVVPPESHTRTKRHLSIFGRGKPSHNEIRRLSVRKRRIKGGHGEEFYDSQKYKRDAEKKKRMVIDGITVGKHRSKRQLSDIEKAYSKYYEKIKTKYRNYVKNLLTVPRARMNASNDYVTPSDNNTKKLQVQDGRWYNSYNNPEFFTRYRATHKARTLSNDLMYDDEGGYPLDEHSETHISIPNINDGPSFKQRKVEHYGFHADHNVSNYYPAMPATTAHPRPAVYDPRWENEYHRVPHHHDTDSHKKLNKSAIIAQLQSQIVRRKRDADDAGEGRRKNKRNDTDTDENGRGKGGNKQKAPCDPLVSDAHMKIEIVRPGKDPLEPFSQGMIVKAVCSKGFISNLQNPNGTAKCVRGRWKPVTPSCNMLPCYVPSTEHGKYFSIPTESGNEAKPTSSPLMPMQKVENGHVIGFQCDLGFNIQGPANIKCWNGDWSTSPLPECLASPCILPQIMHANYQGGYRAGLNIAHGSSVVIQCESGMGNSAPVQMDCALGSLTPQTINCGYLTSRKSRGEVDVADAENSDASSIENNSTMLLEEDNEIMGKECGTPTKIDEMLLYKNEVMLPDSDEGYPTGTEITFDCIPSITGEKTTWKIICEDGSWIGRSVGCGDEFDGLIPRANGSCIFRNNEPHVVSFYNDLEIREDIVEFPAGSTIVSRCVDIGKYAMIGSSSRTCIRSRWSGQKASCFGLNQDNDYAMEKPPTILFRHQNGPIAQSNDGKLIVYPGATVHMECLWMRRFGSPKWNVSQDYRKYPEGWSTDEGRDPQLEYRISIFHAVKDDSGVYTCTTPARHTHNVEVVVMAIHCNELVARRGLSLSVKETMMGTKVHFHCTNGNSLIGAHEVTCLPSGNWSAPLPVCESIECGEVPLTASMNGSTPRVAILSREVGGRAAFSCPLGYGLRGPSEAMCNTNGEWAGPFPTCVEVQCTHPGAPQNGYAQGNPPYRAGDVVQFNCNPEYMMQGQPIIACQDNGRWSGGLPKCVQACSYPGTAISGRMSSVKFYYAIGESITFTCDAGLELRGAKMLKCLKNGKWSNAIPTCINQDAGH